MLHITALLIPLSHNKRRRCSDNDSLQNLKLSIATGGGAMNCEFCKSQRVVKINEAAYVNYPTFYVCRDCGRVTVV